MAPSHQTSPIGIYVHIPFCSHICPYCDFNTYRGLEPLMPRYVDALVTDIRSFTDRHRLFTASSIYLGGGTPSLLSASQVGVIIQELRNAFDLEPSAEITMEANPNSVDTSFFTGLLEAGINRLSIGAQTFDRRGLRTLGRQHEAEDTVTALRAARDAGFANVSLDLIFGWPGQSLEQWSQDLDCVLSLSESPTHVSLYGLIVEPGTPMADAVKRGVMTPVGDDDAADLYELAISRLEAAGWIHYEVANWTSVDGFQSQHNTIYWRNGEYAGFGAGAHWRIGDSRRMNHLLPQTYIDSVQRGDEPVSNSELIDARLSMGETMMLGLRLLREGLSFAEFEARHQQDARVVFGDQITRLTDAGLIDQTDGRITLTRRGLLLANDVCAQFV
ncbi:radical SAM family heme chaperone HemW [soil metagenome]